MSTPGAPTFTTKVFRADGLDFAVTTDGDADRELVERFFRDLQAPEGTEATQVFRLPNLSSAFVANGMGEARAHLSVPIALSSLRSTVNIGALDVSGSRLHVHAAAAASEGRSVVLAAQRNTGKTTTVAEFIGRGWDFLTDETVVLDRSDAMVRGTPLPLSFKPGGIVRLPRLDGATLSGSRQGDQLRFIAASEAGARVVADARPAVVVILRRPPEPEVLPRCGHLHPADAVVALMQETLDAVRFGPDAMYRLAQLAAASHCVEMVLGTPETSVDALEELATRPPELLKVEALASAAALDPEVVTVRIGDRVVIHHRRTGTVLALDPVGTTVWERLGGYAEQSQLELDEPIVTRFVNQLRANELLAAREPIGRP